MSFYHVIAKTDPEGKFRCLFSDLTEDSLKEKFIKPYERGITFFSGNDLFSPSDLISVKIVQTQRTEQIERNEIYLKDREHIDEINRTSELIFVNIGRGYEPEDIAQAGEDVTHTFLKGPPGFKPGKFSTSAKVLGWIASIIATIVAAGAIKWLGWV